MNCRKWVGGVLSLMVVALTGLTAPVIDPIANVTIPAGKSLILPITATSSSGRPLTYTITSSTNAFAVVMHTNNPFWQLTVAQAATNTAPGAYQTPYRGGLVTVTNVGTMTFELFPEYAPHAVDVFQGLTTAGFYNSNTIFHRVISNFMIQGGDPKTNGSGGAVFQYNDEFDPQAIFSGNGQLALANSGPNTDSSQFFITIQPYRYGDFTYTIFGQMVRGFAVLTNINSTAVNGSSRPLADEIIQTATYVTNTTDTALTLTATNRSGVTGTITVIATDGAGGFATNTFTAVTVTDTNSNKKTFFHPITLTNLVGPLNTTLTNYINAIELDGDQLYWDASFVDVQSQTNAGKSLFYNYNSTLKSLTYNVTNVNGGLQLLAVPNTNYAGPINLIFYPSSSSSFSIYAQQEFNFVVGDTPITGHTNTLLVQAGVPFNNLQLATFTNGVPRSPATNFAAVINWGDNTTNLVSATGNAAGLKAVLGSHTYTNSGSYPVYVTVQSSVGASATLISYVNVTNTLAPVTNAFTVQVSGQGTVSPAYANSNLVVGTSYSVTATPSPLWLFSGWTDGNGIVLGTGTNLTFTLTAGMSLTANFLQAVAPTLTITSPTNGAFITNLYSALVSLTGTISNNAIVTNVYYQINGGGWLSATGITNWTGSFTPANGVSNTLQAYAINNFGYLSTTSKILVKYLAGDVLTLTTNGLGSINPNLNGNLLPLGSNYVLTATPASGFTFANWSGSFSTNTAALSFTMATNLTLTANFADATPPTLTIVNPTSGQQVLTSQFTLGGTASDNWAVANVLYSLNHAAWANSSTANGWTNWSTSITLAPGTNTVSAYAVDPNGKASLTNTVNFQYLVTNQLQIRSVGLGTITPNDSNAWLNVGQNYAVTATPANGFAFANWTIATNFSGGSATNNATVLFMMASNLTLQATYTETSRPAVNFTWPTAGLHVTNALPAVVGTATDNWSVVSVAFQLNNGAWYAPNTANGWSNWNTTVQLNTGNNTLNAYALNLGGLYSPTSSISIFSSNAFKLQLNAGAWATNGFNFSLLVSTNLYGHVLYTTNLGGTNGWNTLTNFAGTNGTLNFRDAAATNDARRFYRAVIP